MNQEFGPFDEDVTSMSEREIEHHLTRQYEALTRFSGSTAVQSGQEAELELFLKNIRHLSALGVLPAAFHKYLN